MTCIEELSNVVIIDPCTSRQVLYKEGYPNGSLRFS